MLDASNPHQHLVLSGRYVYFYFVGLICISLMTNEVEHLLLCLLAVWTISFVKCLFRSFVHFSIQLCLIFSSSLCILDISPLNRYISLQISSQVCGMPFHIVQVNFFPFIISAFFGSAQEVFVYPEVIKTFSSVFSFKSF